MDSSLPLGAASSTGHLSTSGSSVGFAQTGRMHHSLSTPAGVDCGGGSLFRTPPSTPKKGGKMLAVRVQMLDDSITMFQVQAKALGRVLFDQVCRQLHLLEADYFGLEYQELGGTKYWLDLEKPICRQVGLSLIDPLLRFCVKFYTPDPSQLEEEFTRYLFCLQIKRDLAHGCIQCNENTSSLMASYIVQAECGDFSPDDYPDHTYLSTYKFFPHQDADLERRIMENHKKHIGQSPAEADLNLLETARRCELYGMKMHPAKDHEGVLLNIAVAHMGIVVFQHLTKINTFSWAKIRKISFKRKKFLIKLHPEGYGFYKDTVEFFFEGRNECKNFWKKCVENHGFFRCSSVKQVPRQRTRVLSRGSSFRYSGRTQKQMVEFVRENYVKRQTVQRSQSFRVSRSLRSSHANVSTGSAHLVNSSVSAHPLLPLPPGSNAISLEWDKQPQYQEASLMMKGYTGEAARELLGRRKSEGATPTTTHMTSAAMREQEGIGLVTQVEVNHLPMEVASPQHLTMTPLDSPESTWSQSTSLHSTSVPGAAQHQAAANPSGYSVMEVSENKVECHSPRNEAFLYSVNLDSISKAESADKKAANEMNNTKDKINDIAVVKPRVHPNSDSSYSIDVLSGGESENENLWKRNYSSSHILKLPVTSKDGVDYPTGTSTSDIKSMKRSPQGDKGFYIAKEILMTERTFKRDLEVISALLRSVIPEELEHEFCDSPIWVPLDCLLSVQGLALRGLEFKLSANPGDVNGNSSNKSTGGIMLDYLKESFPFYDKWIGEHFEYIRHLEDACVNSSVLEKACRDAELYQGECYLPINTFLLKPLYRLVHLRKVLEFALGECQEDEELMDLQKCIELIKPLCEGVKNILPKSLNFSYLCMLHRDIEGVDNLVQLERHFLGRGCLYRHSSKGPQQRMFFLFSDILVYTSKSYSPHQQFRIHGIIQLSSLTVDSSQFNNSFTLYGNGKAMTISASSASDRDAWLEDIKKATLQFQPSDSWENVNSRSTSATNSAEELSESAENSTSMVQRSNTLSHVCWHRNTSLSWSHLYHGMENQLSGYLLRKFKNSLGWQKLWVVFASFCLYFYKTCHDEHPLASLPLLGYSVTTPNEKDCINKDFVFKLVFKNHTYFFRAESDYTFKRWMDVIGSATIQMVTSNNNS